MMNGWCGPRERTATWGNGSAGFKPPVVYFSGLVLQILEGRPVAASTRRPFRSDERASAINRTEAL